ncbi:hypothetical protein BKA93DRAFT_747000 [Sparassis latifolia]
MSPTRLSTSSRRLVIQIVTATLRMENLGFSQGEPVDDLISGPARRAVQKNCALRPGTFVRKKLRTSALAGNPRKAALLPVVEASIIDVPALRMHQTWAIAGDNILTETSERHARRCKYVRRSGKGRNVARISAVVVSIQEMPQAIANYSEQICPVGDNRTTY